MGTPLETLASQQFVAESIDKLRRKLLDLTARNPLLAFKHATRSRRSVRVVDELPDQLHLKLATGKSLRFKGLPQPDNEPADEKTIQFRRALEQAKLEDEVYTKRIEELGPDANDRELQLAEFELRARVRESLGLPPATRSVVLTPTAVAKAMGIDPTFDLPAPGAQPLSAKHDDDAIQTLLFDEQLHHTLNGIRDHTRSSLDETGVNILYCAFGFLEWFEDETSRTALHAPLLLYPIEIRQQLVRGQYQYAIASIGDDLLTNATLRERLRRDFALELPDIAEEETPESYFGQVQRVIETHKSWRVKRWITVGLFNFTRLAMYEDLDPSAWPTNKSLVKHAGVGKLLAGCNAEPSHVTYASDEDLESDDFGTAQERPEILTIHDADSSQIHAIQDVLSGKDLVIEGPPGTGKSQTITNIIAAAIAQQKTVLFVAEKMAALNVVHSRMRDAGLGEFCLPIHSTKASRHEVVKAIGDRVKFPRHRICEVEINTAIAELQRLRMQLRGYVVALNQPAGEIGKTIHDVFWRLQRLRDEYPDLPSDLDEITLENAESITVIDAQRARHALEMLATQRQSILDRYQSVRRHPWYGIAHHAMDPFTASDVIRLVRSIAESAKQCAAADRTFSDFVGIDQGRSIQQMQALVEVVNKLVPPAPNIQSELASRLATREARVVLAQFIDAVNKYRTLAAEIPNKFQSTTAMLSVDLSELQKIEAQAHESQLQSWKVQDIGPALQRATAELQKLERASHCASVIAKLFGLEMIPNIEGLSRLLAACVVASKAPSMLIVGRDQRLLDHNAYEIVRQSVATWKRLSEARTRLEAVFNLSATIDPEVLEAHAASLRNAPVIPWFNLPWWKARQAYQRLSRVPEKLRTADIAARLDALASHVREERKYRSDSLSRDVMGDRFQGIETDFKPIVTIVDWGKTVRQEFPAVDEIGRIIRNVLFETPPENFEALRAQARDASFTILDEVCRSASPDDHVHALVERCRKRAATLQKLMELANRCALNPNVALGECGNLAAEVQRYRDLHAYLHDGNQAEALLGTSYAGPDTELAPLVATAAYAQQLEDANLPTELTQWLLASDQASRLHRVQDLAHQIGECVQRLHRDRDALYALTPIDTKAWLGFDDLLETQPLELSTVLEKAAQLPEELEALVDDQRAEHLVLECGLQQLLDLFERAKHPLQLLPIAYDRVLHQSIARAAVSRSPDLQRFAGMTHEKARERFRQLDRQLIELHRKQLACELMRRPVEQGTNTGSRKTWTGMRLIELEISKQQQHPPIRNLMDRAGQAIQQLMPCFMMSPLTVAQFLQPGGLHFDLVIMDEASQLRPEDAIGAIARGSQFVIVGDPKQLPPTDFFHRANDSEDDDGSVADEESILDAALAVVRPARRLKWHYRSRHESLIAYSNREFYDRDLVVFPSPHNTHGDYGVRQVRVPDGHFKNRVNMKEVERIAQDAIEFMQQHPDRSLGIVAMNQPQRDAISLRMDELFESHPAAEAYRLKWEDTLEPFFVKNLENVQGDERDAIFISTVYGPDEEGNFHQRFGPINTSGGHRRLNVLFTRAKYQVVVFTSMVSGMIRADERSSWGVRVLKGYLDYASTGRLTQPVVQTGRSPESDFEISVARRLQEAGFEVVPQVGVAGYFIDLAVRHPAYPGTFALGIECDGSMYHSAKSARDRDRLRQEILENLGWRIYRIWSLDWYRNTARETQRLIARVKEACAECCQ